MKEQILEQIERIVQNQSISIESDLIGVLDSISFIKVIVAIEKTYGIEFDDDKLQLSEFPNIGAFINYVVSKVDLSKV